VARIIYYALLAVGHLLIQEYNPCSVLVSSVIRQYLHSIVYCLLVLLTDLGLVTDGRSNYSSNKFACLHSVS